MGKPKAKQEVTEYYLSIHAGLCVEADAVTALFVGEKLAWQGDLNVQGGAYVNAPTLFGGPKDQGGVGGQMYFLPGKSDQVMPQSLAQRLGLTSSTCPAFRGIASVFFVGLDGVTAGSIDAGDIYNGGGSSGPTVGDGSTTTGGGSYTTGGGGGAGKTTRPPNRA